VEQNISPIPIDAFFETGQKTGEMGRSKVINP
jgi:hypothetical protein